MIANLGLTALTLSFLCAVYSVVAALYGARRARPMWVVSARHALILIWPLLSLVGLAIILTLMIGNYNVVYAYNASSRAMPIYLRITSWWGGQAGSLTFWSWLMAAFCSTVMLRNWKRDDDLLPYVIVVIGITLAFFLGCHYSSRILSPAGGRWGAATRWPPSSNRRELSPSSLPTGAG